MSQKQAKGRKKGGDDNKKVSGNEWEGYKGMWMECGNDMNVRYGCKLKHQMVGVVRKMSSGVECVW